MSRLSVFADRWLAFRHGEAAKRAVSGWQTFCFSSVWPGASKMKKLLIASLWALLGGIATASTELPSVEEPRFFIEQIEVVGVHVARPEIVLAESMLAPGQELGEGELAAAMARIRRLPFVIDATFALRKGSERGRYKLEIEVEEAQRFFFGQNLVYTRFTNSLAINDEFFAANSSLSPGELAGVRFFAGRYTMLFASASAGRGFQAGFTQYNLFDRRIFLSLALQSSDCCAVDVFPLGIDPTFSSWISDDDYREASLTLGMPLTRDQSLRLRLSKSTSALGQRRNLLGLDSSRAVIGYHDLEHDQVELAWIRDTSDDPILPTSGYTLTGFLDARNFSAVPDLPGSSIFGGPVVVPGANVPGVLPEFGSRQLRLSFSVAQHFPLSPRQVVSASARAGAGVATIENLPVIEQAGDEAVLELVREKDLQLLEGHLTAGYSLALWDAAKTRERGDLRLEVGFEFGYDRTSPDLGLDHNPLYRKGASASVVFRNRWGIFRFTFQVADYGRGF
jgi:hypothetical protein